MKSPSPALSVFGATLVLTLAINWAQSQPAPTSRPHNDSRSSTSRPTTAPASSPATQPELIDRIEDWLAERRQRIVAASDSRRETAAAYLAGGEFERAAKAFDRLLVERPNDADLLMGEALALGRLHRHEDALPLLLSIVGREPRNTAACYHYGVTLTRLGRREEAISAFCKLLEVAPGHNGAMFNLAILQQSLGRMEDAWITWRRLTSRLSEPAASRPAEGGLDPALACEAWFHRGEVEMAMHQVKDAESCFIEVTRQTPNDALAWCNLGIARSGLAHREEAMSALHEALRLDPKLVSAMNQLAYEHAARYRDAGAVEDRQAVLDLAAKSLAIRSQQPNIRALRDAMLDANQPPTPQP